MKEILTHSQRREMAFAAAQEIIKGESQEMVRLKEQITALQNDLNTCQIGCKRLAEQVMQLDYSDIHSVIIRRSLLILIAKRLDKNSPAMATKLREAIDGEKS